ncbi:MAG: hypothetical protein LBG80_14175 [Bacteroidales bacterium]|jgi:hypothetical protein|nr:hypothetical protein [Bacteroidales bacterium]
MTKERILQFIEFKAITKSIFFEKTGIKRGFLDADKLTQAVSDEHFAKIVAAFPDINLEWLLTGNGEMLKKNEVVEQKNKSENEIFLTFIEKHNQELKTLYLEVGALRNENQNLKSKLEEYESNRKKTIDMVGDNQEVRNI